VCQFFVGAPYTPTTVSATSTSDQASFEIEITYTGP
jgi:hypothetical protein